jgi:DNA-binding NtrC family response regulator
MNRKRILLIEDDQSLVLALRYMLEDMGYDLVVAQDHEQAASAIDAGPYAVAIIDYLVDNIPSSPLLAELRERYPQMPLICSTAAVPLRLEANGTQPDAFLQKPFGAEELRRTLRLLVA